VRADRLKIDHIDVFSNFCGAAGVLAALLAASMIHLPTAPEASPPTQEMVEMTLEAGVEPAEALPAPQTPEEMSPTAPQPLLEAPANVPTPSDIVAAPRKVQVKREKKPAPRVVEEGDPRPKHRDKPKEKPAAKPERVERVQTRVGHSGRAERATQDSGRREAADRGARSPQFARPSGNGAAYNACLQSTPYPAAAIRQGRPSCAVRVSNGHLAGGCGSAILESAAQSAVARCTALYGPASGTLQQF